MPSQLIAIPLDQIQPHPRLAFRFKYDVSSLADSIRAVADDTVPNGQLNPGRVVRRSDGDGYYVYIGVRRFLALKQLSENTKGKRFGLYNAYVDENLSELQMFEKAKAENEEGKGERLGLSVLEQASGFLRIRDSVDAEELDDGLRRLLVVAEKLGQDKLAKLYDVERASQKKFTISQLGALCKVEGEREFFTTAASAAEFGMDDVKEAEKSREAAYHLDWFPSVFPGLKKEESTTTPKASLVETGGRSADRHLEIHEAGVIVVNCARCGGGNMFQIEGEVDVTHLSPNPDGAKETKVADALVRGACTCSNCGKDFYILVRHLEGRSFAVASHFSETFIEPDRRTEALDLHYDHETKTWQRIVDGKVAGPLELIASRIKR